MRSGVCDEGVISLNDSDRKEEDSDKGNNKTYTVAIIQSSTNQHDVLT